MPEPDHEPKHLSVPAIVLAAGASERMGRPKALLEFAGRSFISQIVGQLNAAGLHPVVVVVGPDGETIRQHLAGHNLVVVENRNPQAGQLSSILIGLDALKGVPCDAVLIHPVDHPAVAQETMVSLVVAFRASRAPITLPEFDGKRGHPVVFSAGLFEELKAAPADVGARAVVWAHANDLAIVPTTDKGVILNIDTKEEYEHLQENLRPPAS